MTSTLQGAAPTVWHQKTGSKSQSQQDASSAVWKPAGRAAAGSRLKRSLPTLACAVTQKQWVYGPSCAQGPSPDACFQGHKPQLQSTQTTAARTKLSRVPSAASMGRKLALSVLVALLAVQMSVALHPGDRGAAHVFISMSLQSCKSKEVTLIRALPAGQSQQHLHASGLADANGCEGTANEDACLAVKGCAWCTSGAVGDFCATDEEAKRLPPAVFTCKASVSAAGQMGDKTASPSPAVSSAKTRRLDALHRRLGGKRAGAAQHPGRACFHLRWGARRRTSCFPVWGSDACGRDVCTMLETCGICWQVARRLGIQTRGTRRAMQW